MDKPTTALPPLAIVMAAGHGKRIKSHRSKMLHEIWGVPAIARVCRAVAEGLADPHLVVVVGIQADEVKACLGEMGGLRFAMQSEQRGTGHAVLTAVAQLTDAELERGVYVVPGDKALLDAATVAAFRQTFEQGAADMLITTAMHSGPAETNTHGRLLRVPERDAAGEPAPALDVGAPIGIVERRDILALDEGATHCVKFRGHTYAFARAELLEIREFNASLYGFRGRHLRPLLEALRPDNAQGEIYLTDLVYRFLDAGLSVQTAAAPCEEVVLDFNDKTGLRRIESLHRKGVFDRLKNLITIEDEDDFFLADEVVTQLLAMDRAGTSPDLFVGQGAYIGAGVTVGPRGRIGRYAHLDGCIRLGADVRIGASAQLRTLPHQAMSIGDETVILDRNSIKGNVTIGRACRIETTARMTGSEEHPMQVGNGVRIKGTTYLYGCEIEDNVFLQNCYLFQKRIRYREDAAGNPVRVAHIFPEPMGRDCVEDR